MGRMREPKPVSELAEQKRLCSYLNPSGILYCHVPNGGHRARRTGGGKGMGEAEGVKAGFPDLMFFDAPRAGVANASFGNLAGLRLAEHGLHFPENREHAHGLIMEMKIRNATFRHVTAKQVEWLWSLRNRGWVVGVGYGFRDALSKLVKLGYPVKLPDPIPWERALGLRDVALVKRDCPFCRGQENTVRYTKEVLGCLACARSWGTV